MKKLLSALGIILMFFGGIGCVSFLAVLPRTIFSQDASIGLAAALLFDAALSGGLFALGWKLHHKNRSGARPAKDRSRKQQSRTSPQAQSQPQPRPQPQAQPRPVNQAAAAPCRHTARRLEPVSAEDTIRLYRNDDAAKKALYDLREVIREVRLERREGDPALVCYIYEGVEHGPGKAGIEDHEETHALPSELLATLTPEELENLVKQTLGDRCPIAWDDRYMRWKLTRWCSAVRRGAGNDLPPGLYPVDAPFPVLKNIGPDGLDDGSGIDTWARIKTDAKLPDIVSAFAQRGPSGVVFVLTEGSAGTPGLLSEEDRLLLDLCHVRFGYLTAPDRVKNLVDGREYKVQYQQWPGSADDAATYGRWCLEELPLSTESRLFDITEQIVSDCRELGISEERIRRLYRDGLSRTAHDMCSQLSFDEESGEYVVYYWEKGTPSCTVAARDPMEFRFLFLQAYVYHITFISPNMHDMDAASNMLQAARQKFRHTKAYQASLRAYGEAFGPLRDPSPSPDYDHGDIKRPICPALYDFQAADHFFGELLLTFTDLHPREYFNDKWASSIPTGRYVVLVAERHSVYLNLQCIYENPDFTGEPDSCWRGTVPAYRLYYENASANPGLWNRTKTENLSLEQAKETAARMSYLLKTRVCVARTVADYNMF